MHILALSVTPAKLTMSLVFVNPQSQLLGHSIVLAVVATEQRLRALYDINTTASF